MAPDSGAGSNWIRNLVLLQVAIAIVTILIGKPHTFLHGMSWPLPAPGEVARFDFIGKSEGSGPSIWSVLLETAAWSFLGVMARAEYRLARTVQQKRRVDLLPAISQLLGDAAAGISIAVALVALLWSSEFTIVDIQITLKKAGIGSIIAVSFVLGFFHDRTQRILGLVQGKLFGSSDANDQKTS